MKNKHRQIAETFKMGILQIHTRVIETMFLKSLKIQLIAYRRPLFFFKKKNKKKRKQQQQNKSLNLVALSITIPDCLPSIPDPKTRPGSSGGSVPTSRSATHLPQHRERKHEFIHPGAYHSSSFFFVVVLFLLTVKPECYKKHIQPKKALKPPLFFNLFF